MSPADRQSEPINCSEPCLAICNTQLFIGLLTCDFKRKQRSSHWVRLRSVHLWRVLGTKHFILPIGENVVRARRGPHLPSIVEDSSAPDLTNILTAMIDAKSLAIYFERWKQSTAEVGLFDRLIATFKSFMILKVIKVINPIKCFEESHSRRPEC